MSVDAISQAVRSTHGLALLMAAILHDYRHPGVNNGFLVRELNPLAVTYNDSSVLENFHAAEGFKLMLDPKFNVFKVNGCVSFSPVKSFDRSKDHLSST